MTIINMSGGKPAKPVVVEAVEETPSTLPYTFTPREGVDYLSSVTVGKDPNLVPGNVKKDVSIFGTVGTLEGGGEGDLTPIANGTMCWTWFGFGSTHLKSEGENTLHGKWWNAPQTGQVGVTDGSIVVFSPCDSSNSASSMGYALPALEEGDYMIETSPSTNSFYTMANIRNIALVCGGSLPCDLDVWYLPATFPKGGWIYTDYVNPAQTPLKGIIHLSETDSECTFRPLDGFPSVPTGTDPSTAYLIRVAVIVMAKVRT